jgi:glycosyltransferase involved in cell wall biosynthesis
MALMHEAPTPAARRLLIVTYWYPPAVGAASERLWSFAKYLSQLGWEIHLVTASRSPAAVDLPGVHVHAIDDPLGDRVPVVGDYDPRRTTPRWRKWLRDFAFPDRFKVWSIAAAKEATRIVREQGIDLILASFPPASAVTAALEVHDITRVPMVLDFRDRWLGPGGYEPVRAAAMERHQALERRAIKAARGIVVISEAMASGIAEEHNYPRDRIIVVPNGYEPSDTQSWPAPPAPPPLIVAHVGTVIARNRPDLLFASLKELAKQKSMSGVRWRFVGNLLASYLRDEGLDSFVETTGMISRDEARREMNAAHALVLLVGDYVGRWGHNAKLFEYLQTGRPILCLEESPPSNDRQLLEQFAPERSFFARLHDSKDIEEQLAAVGQIARESRTQTKLPREFEFYSRKRVAAQLNLSLLGILQGSD